MSCHVEAAGRHIPESEAGSGLDLNTKEGRWDDPCRMRSSMRGSAVGQGAQRSLWIVGISQCNEMRDAECPVVSFPLFAFVAWRCCCIVATGLGPEGLKMHLQVATTGSYSCIFHMIEFCSGIAIDRKIVPADHRLGTRYSTLTSHF